MLQYFQVLAGCLTHHLNRSDINDEHWDKMGRLFWSNWWRPIRPVKLVRKENVWICDCEHNSTNVSVDVWAQSSAPPSSTLMWKVVQSSVMQLTFHSGSLFPERSFSGSSPSQSEGKGRSQRKQRAEEGVSGGFKRRATVRRNWMYVSIVYGTDSERAERRCVSDRSTRGQVKGHNLIALVWLSCNL